jgi:hypothetical protein
MPHDCPYLGKAQTSAAIDGPWTSQKYPPRTVSAHEVAVSGPPLASAETAGDATYRHILAARKPAAACQEGWHRGLETANER